MAITGYYFEVITLHVATALVKYTVYMQLASIYATLGIRIAFIIYIPLGTHTAKLNFTA